MDLLIIPVLLGIGGGLIYLGTHGVPQLPSLKGEPFRMAEWMKARPAAGNALASRGRPTSHDTELVELMNEMIAVREELSGLRECMAARPAHRQLTRKTTTAKTVKPVAMPETRSKLPVPAKAEVPQRRQGFAHGGRRYVRAH